MSPTSKPGLQDPRVIHPSPEDIVSDPTEPAKDEATQEPASSVPPENQVAEEVAPGIVDPRVDPIGPDLSSVIASPRR
jgi:hypothetical protein